MTEPAYLRVRDVDPARFRGTLHIDFKDRAVWYYAHADHPQFGAAKSTPRRGRGPSTVTFAVEGVEGTFTTLRDAIAAWNRRLRDAAQSTTPEDHPEAA